MAMTLPYYFDQVFMSCITSPSELNTWCMITGHSVEFKWSTLKYMRLLRRLQIYESDIEEGGAGILVQVDGDPVPPTYYIYTTKRGYAYLH